MKQSEFNQLLEHDTDTLLSIGMQISQQQLELMVLMGAVAKIIKSRTKTRFAKVLSRAWFFGRMRMEQQRFLNSCIEVYERDQILRFANNDSCPEEVE